MKKLLIIGALAGVGLYFYSKKDKDDTAGTPIVPATEDPEAAVFRMYNNQVIADKDGNWMLVKDGKLFSPQSLETLNAWQRANPDKPPVIMVTDSIWAVYGNAHYGGSF